MPAHGQQRRAFIAPFFPSVFSLFTVGAAARRLIDAEAAKSSK
jgi:hypothetical protein